MKSFDHIESNLKKFAHKHSVDAPELIWDNIEESLDTKSEKKGYFWRGLGIGLLLLGSLMFYFQANINKNPFFDKVAVISEQPITNNSGAKNSSITSNDQNPSNSQNLESVVMDESNYEIFDEKNKTNLTKEPSKLSANSTLISTTDSTSKVTSKVTTKATINSISKAASGVKIYSEELINDNFSVSPITSENRPIETNSTNLSTATAKPILDDGESSPQMVFDKIVSDHASPVITLEEQELISNLNPINSLNQVIFCKDIPVELNRNSDCPNFKEKQGIRPFLEINGLLGLNNKQLESKEEAEEQLFADLKANREETESSWYNWGGNVLAGLNFNSNFYAGIGVDFMQAKEKFNYRQEGLGKIIISFNPETNTPIDTSVVFGTLLSEGEVRYSAVDIPLVLGYQKFHKTWVYGLELGALYNLSFRTSGKILNTDNAESRIEAESFIYRNKLHLGFKGSLVVSKDLGNGFSVHFKPGYRRYLNTIDDPSYPLKTTMDFMNVEMGCRMNF